MRTLITSILLTACLASCKVQNTGMHTDGQILLSEEDRLFVIFEGAFKKNTLYAEWFYFPSHGIVDKEKYKIIVSLTKIP